MNVSSATQTQYTQATNKTTATKASSAYDSVAPTQQTDKMAQMQEKYKDVYTPIPETYSKADEELQTRKIYESYPNYVPFQEFLKIADSFYDGPPKRLGDKPNQEVLDKEKIAFDKAYALFGGEDAYMEMLKGVKEIQNDYPINNWAKENISNAKELARFDNAAVSEGLENGKRIEDAKRYAGSIRDKYMDMSCMPDTFFDTLVKAGRADTNAKQPSPEEFKPNFNAVNNTIWDLRQYGIEDDWTKNSIYNNDKAMISELNKKMGQFNFMLNNENLMKEANSKLDSGYQNLAQANHYKENINNKYLPEAKFALDIFKNYKIYDSVDVKA